MSIKNKNLPLETDFYPNHTKPKAQDRPHIYDTNEREYVEADYVAKEYPKAMYHPDYIHEKKADRDYSFTECAQLVNSSKEEKSFIADGWLESPQCVTSPNAEQVAKKAREDSINWRKAAQLPYEGINERHIAFAQSQGLDIKSMADLYSLLKDFSGSQMQSFQRDAKKWMQAQDEPKSKAS
jgi:hypothetical protein